jgi:hypothetical protein
MSPRVARRQQRTRRHSVTTDDLSSEQQPVLAAAYPIRLVVTDDLARSRATVFFRLILAIPHLIWLTLWGIAAGILWFVNWIWTLVAGRSPEWAHSFFTAFTRYTVHTGTYLSLAAEPFPKFLGDPGYPVDLEVDPPRDQRRLVTGFRIILAIPMLIVAGALQYVQGAVAVIAWFYCLFVGRMHEGMRNIITFCVAFNARVNGYAYFLTDRYPPFSERAFPPS